MKNVLSSIKKKLNSIMLFIALFLAILFFGLRILSKIYAFNTTPSTPIGIYKLEKFDGKLKRGDYIVYEIDEKYKNLSSIRGTIFKSVKPVAGFHGDRIEIINNRIYVNGEDFGEIHKEVISVFQGYVGEDEVLTLSKVKGTLDGRYYGAVKKSKIEKKARLVYEF